MDERERARLRHPRPGSPVSIGSRHAATAASPVALFVALAVAVAGCGSETVSPAPGSAAPSGATASRSEVPSGAPLTSVAPSAPSSGAPLVAPAASASAAPTLQPSPAGSPGPTTVPGTKVVHDPAKFGFAAKGMSNEMMAFVTADQIPYALDTMDWDVVSTVAYFSLEATADGSIARDDGWRAWSSEAMERLIEKAHANGTKVVISLERFAWSRDETAISRALLRSEERRLRLAREVAAEVERMGVDGVNVDFEPIPPGQKGQFTALIRTLRRELDAIGPGMQLTFDVVGHHESYDVRGATGPDAADAVYLMGYQYAGNWSSQARSTAPMGGEAYDLVDTVKSLLKEIDRNQLILGVPYYGHAWPTAGDRLNARTEGGGFDVPYERAIQLAEKHGKRYDEVEEVAWVAYRAKPCDGCGTRWYQLYFDDERAAEYKWVWVRRNNLLGSGVWTIGFEGERGPLDRAMRAVFLRR